jgi:hypothetical protein
MMMNRISVMATAVGFSVASLSAHGAAKELLCIDDASPARMAITESIDRLSSSFSDSTKRGAVTIGARAQVERAQVEKGSGPRRLTVTRTVSRTVTRNPKSAELFAHADPKGGMLRLDTHEPAAPVNPYVGINHVGAHPVQSGATGGSGSNHIVTPGVPRGTTTPQVNAPEIDPASAVGGLTLLAGAIVALRGRRRVLTPC